MCYNSNWQPPGLFISFYHTLFLYICIFYLKDCKQCSLHLYYIVCNSWYSMQCFRNLTGAWFGKLLSWNSKYFQKDIVLGQAVQGVFHGKRIEKQKITLISALFSEKRPKIALHYMPIHTYFIQNKIWTVCIAKVVYLWLHREFSCLIFQVSFDIWTHLHFISVDAIVCHSSLLFCFLLFLWFCGSLGEVSCYFIFILIWKLYILLIVYSRSSFINNM